MEATELSRRDWIKTTFFVFFAGGSVATTATAAATVASANDDDDENTQSIISLRPAPSSSTITTSPSSSSSSAGTTTATTTVNKQLTPVNLTKVAIENRVNVSLQCKADMTCYKVDQRLFNKIQVRDVPAWVPSWIPRPKPIVLRPYTGPELWIASSVAGAMVDMTRTFLLFPLSTIKARIQADSNYRRAIRRRRRKAITTTSLGGLVSTTTTTTTKQQQQQQESIIDMDKEDELFIKDEFAPPVVLSSSRYVQLRQQLRSLQRELQILALNFQRRYSEGNLYQGIWSSLLISVPASATYYGVRDVTKRMLNVALSSPNKWDDLIISLSGALVADIIYLTIRTPVDTYAIRKQVNQVMMSSSGSSREDNNNNNKSESSNKTTTLKEKDDENKNEEESAIVGNWWRDGIERLPTIIVTDVPYLLSKIALNGIVLQGSESLSQYELVVVVTACTSAFLTTPLDVVRTRILVDSDGDPTNGMDGGSFGLEEEGIVQTMKRIIREGGGSGNNNKGRVSNLFAGWLERTIYLGLGRAWLDPFLLLFYVWVRDAVLLEWFD